MRKCFTVVILKLGLSYAYVRTCSSKFHHSGFRPYKTIFSSIQNFDMYLVVYRMQNVHSFQKLSYIIKFSLSVCLSLSMLVWNRLPNHAYYGDEAVAGDSVRLGLGQRLNLIFKKLIVRYYWGKIAPDEKYCSSKFNLSESYSLICFSKF